MENHINTSELEAREVFIRRIVRGVYTHIPGIVTSFNEVNQTAKVIPAIRAIQNIDNEITFKDLPELIEVPVLFVHSASSGFSLTCPVEPGDECLLSFCQRSIDNWHELGSVQNPVEKVMSRSHSISDAIAFVGISSKPNVITGFRTDGIEIRDESGTVRTTVFKNRVEIANNSSFPETSGTATGQGPIQTDFNIWNSILSGSFAITIDDTTMEIAGLDFSGTASLDDVALICQKAIQAVGFEGFANATCEYIGVFKFTSGTTGIDSSVTNVIGGLAEEYPYEFPVEIGLLISGGIAIDTLLGMSPALELPGEDTTSSDSQIVLNQSGNILVRAGGSTITIDPAGSIVVVPAGGTTEFTGNISVSGTVTAGEVIGGGKVLSSHTHPENDNAPAPTGPPT